MGGIEEKVIKANNLINKGKFKEGISIYVKLFEHKIKDEIKHKLYSQYFNALLKVSKNCKDISLIVNILVSGFSFLKDEEDKKKVRQNVINTCLNEKIDSLEKIFKDIKKINDFELDFCIRQLYEQKLIKENKIIQKNEIETIDKNIEIINSLRKKLIIESSIEWAMDNLIELYINKGKLILNKILTISKVSEIEEESKNFQKIMESLNKIKARKESIDYINSLKETSNSYKLMIKGKELMAIQDYKSALIYFNDIETDKELFQINQLKNICNSLIGKALENEKKYKEAIKYYENIENIESEGDELKKAIKIDVERMKILISFEKAKLFLENGEYNKSINEFVNMYKIRQKCKNQIEENTFTICMEPFLYALSLEAFKIYQLDSKNELLNFEKEIENISISLKDNLIEKNLLEILKFLKEIKDFGKKELISKILNIKNINAELSEMLQRIYIEILISLMKSEETGEKIQILKIIIKFVEEGLYISKINIIKLRNLFSLNNKDNKELLPLVSELYYYFTNKGLEYEKSILLTIGNTIHSIDRDKRNKKSIYSPEEYNTIMKYLFLSLEKLIKEREYNLTDVANKIYEKILESEKNNQEILKVLINGYYYFDQKNLVFTSKAIQLLLEILNMREKNNTLFEMVLSQFNKNGNKYSKQIPLFFKLIFKYHQYEKKILEILTSIEIPEAILNIQDFHKYIDIYISKERTDDLIYKLIEKIATSYRTSKMIEKLKNKDIEKKNSLDGLKPEIDKRELKLREYNEFIECGINLDYSQLEEIENNIDLKGFIELLSLVLTKQNELIEKVNLDIISKYFCKKNYSLFQIIYNHKRIWNDKSLYIIAKGLGRNNEDEKKIILNFFEEIQKYQNIPKFIINNLNIERTIKNYENLDKIENKELIKLLDEFKNIKNLSQKYLIILNKYIINYINNPDKIEKEKNIIIEKILELLKTSSFNISIHIIEFCLNNISFNTFIKSYPQILSNYRIKHKLKKFIFDKLLDILKKNSEDKQLEIIKEMKYFVDCEPLPNNFVSFLTNLIKLPKDNNFSEITREIIYILGNYFSDLDKEKISNEFIEIINKTEIFNSIKKLIPNLTIQNYIYIFCYIIYSNNNIKESEYYNYPRSYLVNLVEQKLNSANEKDIFIKSLEYFERYHNFDILSPKRDKLLRKLIYNAKINIRIISKILIQNCSEENKIEKVEGEIVNGKLFGYGKMYYTNGDYYSGFFINNIKEGEGMLFSKNNPQGIHQTWKNGILVK